MRKKSSAAQGKSSLPAALAPPRLTLLSPQEAPFSTAVRTRPRLSSRPNPATIRLPPAVAVAKRVANPLVIVGTLYGLAYSRAGALEPLVIALGLIALLLSQYLLPSLDLLVKRRELAWDLLRTAAGWALVLLLTLLAGRLLNGAEVLSSTTLVAWALLVPPLIVCSHVAIRYGFARASAAHAATHPAVIVGVNPVAKALACSIVQEPFARYSFAGFFDDREARRVRVVDDRVCGKLDDVVGFVKRHSVRAVYVTLPWSSQARVAKLVDALKDTTASIFFVLDMSDMDLFRPSFFELGSVAGVSVCESPFHGLAGAAKRALDVVVSVAAIVLMAPVMLAIAVAIKATSRGPIIFVQRRYGLDGQDIAVYKFRTMKVQEDGAVVRQATRDDDRVTPIGAFLRRTSLDELPQFFNVLQGRMSVVGPRPHAAAHNEHYRRLVKGYMLRHKVPPGITGWAQINGFRGETDTLEKMEARVQLDLDYLRNWSPWLDLQIIGKTALVVLSGKNAY